jgi:hypothetical protein
VGMAVIATAWMAASASAIVCDSFFDVFTELSVGPPYPTTTPTQTMVSFEKEAGVMVQTEILKLGIKDTTYQLPAHLAAHDSGGGGGAGIQSFFDIYAEVTTGGGYPVDSFFDIFLEAAKPAIDKSSPMLAKPPAVTYADSFFDIFVEVTVGGEEEEEMDILHLHGDIGPGQPLTFDHVGTGNVADSFFDIFVEIDVDGGGGGGGVLPDVPLVKMTMTGIHTPEPGTLVMVVLGGLALLARRGRRAA